MWSYRFVLQDVSRVIEGLNVDGVSRLPKTVSFPRHPDTVNAVVSLAQVLYTFVGATHRTLADDHAARTAIVFKLLAYLTRTGRACPDAIRASIQDVAGAATILSERPELIAASVNFANLLARHTQAQRERDARRKEQVPPPDAAPPVVAGRPERPPPVRRPRVVKRKAPATPPPDLPCRPVIWQSADGQYCLQELIHPWHLVEETKALGHCIGRHPVNYAARGGDVRQLAYWCKIESGRSRIFSFASQGGPQGGPRGGPLCTLHIMLPHPMLVEAGPKHPRVLMGNELYFPVLVEAIEGLDAFFRGSLCFDLGRLPRTPRRYYCEGPLSIGDQFKQFLTRRYGFTDRFNS